MNSKRSVAVRRAAILALAHLWLLSAPVDAVECAVPVVIRAALRDIHESWWNGPVGYAFLEGMGGEKSGRLPQQVGRDPVRRFEVDAYASNFQGPVAVQHSGLRLQWEWTADGATEISDRSFPLLVARRCAESGASLPVVTVRVAEHDEWPLGNDGVGAFDVDLGACASVLSEKRASGWTDIRRTAGLPYEKTRGAADIEFVDYLVWCYRCMGDSDCEDAIAWPSDRER